MDLSKEILNCIRTEQLLTEEYVRLCEEERMCITLLSRIRTRTQAASVALEERRREIWKMKQRGYEIDHIDGDPTNFKLSNLRVVTRKENLPRKRGQR